MAQVAGQSGYGRVVFFQPRTWAAAHYADGAGGEQTWTPWFAPFLATAARAAGLRAELIDARVHPDWRQRLAGVGAGDVLAASVMTGAAITDARWRHRWPRGSRAPTWCGVVPTPPCSRARPLSSPRRMRWCPGSVTRVCGCCWIG